jgi:hypothetical protein
MERMSTSCMSRWTRLRCTKSPSARRARVICREPMMGCAKQIRSILSRPLVFGPPE